jgi:tetratricopeptide (TPR) repeat protein
MPSLSALAEFRNSFSNIANEKEDLASRGLPYAAIDLPDTEAPPFEQPSREAGSPPDFSTDGADIADGAADGAGAGDFDFNAFINSVPTDSPPPPDEAAPDVNFDDLFNDTAAQTQEPQSTDDFLNSLGGDTPSDAAPADETAADDDLLNSLGGDTPSDATSEEETPADIPSEDGMLSDDESFPTDDFLNSLGSDASSDATPSEETPAEESLPADELPDFPETETPTTDEDFSVPPDLLSGLGDEIESAPSDFPAEEPPAEEPPTEDIPTGDFSTEDFSTEDFSTEGFPSEEEESEETIDLGGERQDGTLSADSGTKGFMPANDSDETSGDETSGDETSGDEMSGDETSVDDLPETLTPETDGTDEILADNASEPQPSPQGEDSPLEDASMPDFDLPETPFDDGIDQGGETLSDETPEEEHIDLGGESMDFDLPETDSSAKKPASEDFGFDDEDILPGSGLPDGSEFIQTEPEGIDMPGLDLPDMDFDTAEPSGDSDADESGGLPNMEDFGGDFSSDSIDLENEPQPESGSEPAAATSFSDDDFALPGLDDIFDKSKTDTTQKPAPKKGFFKRKKAEVVEEEEEHDLDDSDEINLSQSDVEKLMKTLENYPLNLRVACEELIAEQVILPQQLSKLLRMLIRGANVKEMAEFAGQLLGKEIVIPRSYEKSTGAEWEAEKSSFAYIFVNNFLPVLRIVAMAVALLGSTAFLSYKFIYLPLKAESLYKRGYERIGAGEYQRADELFHQAFTRHRKKKWFYTYAEGFRDQRRYLLAENKYDELLRYYPRDKKGVLDYANLETYYILNYEKANKLLQNELLDYAPDDYDGLLAAGDNFLAWADSDPAKYYDKYEDARFCYARILQDYGWTGPVLERMLLYFMHTDNLKETLNLRAWFENNSKKYKLTTPTLAELGGYLLDKQLEKVKGVPNAYVESIESVRDMLLQAVKQDNHLPEPHYHLARYYHNLGNLHEERLTLENAIRAYDLAKTESVRRRLNRVDTHYRYANMLINNKEFFSAEEQLVRGIELYEEFISRNLIAPSPQLGQLYAGLGDLEYFVKSGNIQAALNNYLTAEKYGYAPPEIQYRIGAGYYQQERWGNALDYLFKAASELPMNRRILFALGNTTYKRGDYFAAQGYYNRLLDILENQRIRLPVLLPNDSAQFLELGERLMMARNNAGVTYEALAKQTGKRDYRSKALSLYADSARSWDAITRNPQSMTRMTIGDTPGAPGINLGYLNANNALHPSSGYNPEIFIRIDKDVSEPSKWEELAPFGGLIDETGY